MTDDSVFNGLLIAVFVWAVGTVLALLVIPAPYGRHQREGWGPKLPTRLAWVLMESPASLCFAYFFFTGPHRAQIAPLILFGLWQLHYAHRAFIYPFQLRVKKGATMTALVVLLGAIYCGVNGYLNGSYVGRFGSHLATSDWLGDWRFIVGVLLFFAGYALNKHSDHVLQNLRKPGETGYKIPYGGGYRFVSSPNYLGELITWTGFALASWSLAGVSFVVFTAANLIPRALTNHRWYQEQFKDYPPERKAVLPFLL